MSGFCILVKLHQEGSALDGATLSSFEQPFLIYFFIYSNRTFKWKPVKQSLVAVSTLAPYIAEVCPTSGYSNIYIWRSIVGVVWSQPYIAQELCF